MQQFFKKFSKPYFCHFLPKKVTCIVKAQQLPWVVVYPVLYCLYVLVGHIVKVYALWYLSSYHFVSVLVCASLPAAVRVAVV